MEKIAPHMLSDNDSCPKRIKTDLVLRTSVSVCVMPAPRVLLCVPAPVPAPTGVGQQ